LKDELKLKDKEIKKLKAEISKKDKKMNSVMSDHEKVLQEKNDEILKLIESLSKVEQELEIEKALLVAAHAEIDEKAGIIMKLEDSIFLLSRQIKSLKRKQGEGYDSDGDTESDDDDSSPPKKKPAFSVIGDEIITYDDSHVIITHRQEALDHTVIDETRKGLSGGV
jgi:chromosome segregation ATPase